MKNQQLVDSLISELNKPKHLSAQEKSLLFANALFSCTISGFSVFLNKQQTMALCIEDLHCSNSQAQIFCIPNGISNSFVSIFTSADLFSAIQRALIGKNNAFYPNQKSTHKIGVRLSLSLTAGLLAAIPIMLSTKDPVGSKLVFIGYFICASYSFYSIATDLSKRSSQSMPNVIGFLQALKSYELKGAKISLQPIPNWIKFSSAVLLPLFFNGPFCVNNILTLNNPDNDLGALQKMIPTHGDDRLIASVVLGTIFTIPWFLLAGLFGYHLPDTLQEQLYLNPFAKINPQLNKALLGLFGLISLCSFAAPAKFFIDVKEELFPTCDEACGVFTFLIAISGVLFSMLPNMKVVELMIIFWNLFLSQNIQNREDTFNIINARALAMRFSDMQITLPAQEVDDISKELTAKLPTATEHTYLLQQPSSDRPTSEDDDLSSKSHASRKYCNIL